jgi:hypothetical protein
MRGLLSTILIIAFAMAAHAAYPGIQQANTPPKIDNNLEKKEKLTPCVKALLNEMPLSTGSNLSKTAKGTLTAENQEDEKVFFNVTLKTNIGKKGEPPIYLRFIKVNQIDIRKVLEYAKAGDEIYIEQFSTDPNMRIRCAPSSLIVT